MFLQTLSLVLGHSSNLVALHLKLGEPLKSVLLRVSLEKSGRHLHFSLYYLCQLQSYSGWVLCAEASSCCYRMKGGEHTEQVTSPLQSYIQICSIEQVRDLLKFNYVIDSNLTCIIFGWEEAGTPGEHPCKREQIKQTPHRAIWTEDLLAVRQLPSHYVSSFNWCCSSYSTVLYLASTEYIRVIRDKGTCCCLPQRWGKGLSSHCRIQECFVKHILGRQLSTFVGSVWMDSQDWGALKRRSSLGLYHYLCVGVAYAA